MWFGVSYWLLFRLYRMRIWRNWYLGFSVVIGLMGLVILSLVVRV